MQRFAAIAIGLLLAASCSAQFKFQDLMGQQYVPASGGGINVSSTPTIWWKFDEGTGKQAADSSGNNYSNSLNGSVGWFSSGSGFAVTNVNAFPVGVSSNTASSFDGMANFSVSVWFKTSIAIQAGSSPLICKGYTTRGKSAWGISLAGTGTGFGGGPPRTNMVFSYLGTDLSNYKLVYTTETNWNDGAWHNAIMVVSNAGAGLFQYVDGVLDANAANGGTLGLYTNSVFVSVFSDQTGQGYYFGALDDARIFTNTVLTPPQVNFIYTNGMQ